MISLTLENPGNTINNFLTKNLISSEYQKNIITNLDSIAVAQYSINPNIPLDPSFFDVLCINCYECVKFKKLTFILNIVSYNQKRTLKNCYKF